MNDVMMESELEGGFMNNLIEAENTIGEASISVFYSADDPMETNSFGQIPHNLSGTDLTAYFANDTGASFANDTRASFLLPCQTF